MTLLAPVAAETAAINTGPVPIPPVTDKRIPWWAHVLMLSPGCAAAWLLAGYVLGGQW